MWDGSTQIAWHSWPNIGPTLFASLAQRWNLTLGQRNFARRPSAGPTRWLNVGPSLFFSLAQRWNFTLAQRNFAHRPSAGPTCWLNVGPTSFGSLAQRWNLTLGQRNFAHWPNAGPTCWLNVGPTLFCLLAQCCNFTLAQWNFARWPSRPMPAQHVGSTLAQRWQNFTLHQPLASAIPTLCQSCANITPTLNQRWARTMSTPSLNFISMGTNIKQTKSQFTLVLVFIKLVMYVFYSQNDISSDQTTLIKSLSTW